eukprot:TRINITY_DN33974_c0_g1_i1.p1 TRINITY_DN33974_c0_g1~~TRINITY_DN33974_c0_g1_i1.p1  ORF type:complete len:945 (-),score=57.37 TRINITY_DN33974_c0_g1_i1:106-2940(-)
MPRPWSCDYKDEILQKLEQQRVVVIVGPTGCGKSTQVPQFFLEEADDATDLDASGAVRIAVAESRRITTMGLATHVAKQRGCKVGDEVGFRIGGCPMEGPDTRLTYLTTAILTKEVFTATLQYTVIVLDEIHERTVDEDIVLCALKTIVLPAKPDLRLVVMSATLDVEKFSRYFDNAPIVRIRETPHRIKELWPNSLPDDLWMDLVHGGAGTNHNHVIAEVIRYMHEDPKQTGDFLVFLSGKREIRAIASYWRRKKWSGATLVALHGQIPLEKQRKAVGMAQENRRSRNFRTIILATDVVESGITIPTIDLVIDACMHKRMLWCRASALPQLTETEISYDECTQRKGRTGRLQDGAVLRLIDEENFRKLEAHPRPQILHTRLADVLLTLIELKHSDPLSFMERLPDTPPKYQTQEAFQKLLQIGALKKIRVPLDDDDAFGAPPSEASDELGQELPVITPKGTLLRLLPLDIDTAVLAVQGIYVGLVNECVQLAAIAQRGSPFWEMADLSTVEERVALSRMKEMCGTESDLLNSFRAYRVWQSCWRDMTAKEEARWCYQHYLSCAVLHDIHDVYIQVLDHLQELGIWESVNTAERANNKKRRQELLSPAIAEENIFQGLEAPDFRGFARKLQGDTTRLSQDDTKLLRWCIGVAFIHNSIETKYDPSEPMEVALEQMTGPQEERFNQFKEWCAQESIPTDEPEHRIGTQSGDVLLKYPSTSDTWKFVQMLLTSDVGAPFGAAKLCTGNFRRGLIPRPCWPNIMLGDDSVCIPCRDTRNPLIVPVRIIPHASKKTNKTTYMASVLTLLPEGLLDVIAICTYGGVKTEYIPGESEDVRRLKVKYRDVEDTHEVVNHAEYKKKLGLVRRLQNTTDWMRTNDKLAQAQQMKLCRDCILELYKAVERDPRSVVERVGGDSKHGTGLMATVDTAYLLDKLQADLGTLKELDL